MEHTLRIPSHRRPMAQTHAFDALSNILANTLSEPLLESTANALRGLLALPNDSGVVHADDYMVLIDRIAIMLASEPWSESACMALIRLTAEACEDGAAEDTSKRGSSSVSQSHSSARRGSNPNRCRPRWCAVAHCDRTHGGTLDRRPAGGSVADNRRGASGAFGAGLACRRLSERTTARRVRTDPARYDLTCVGVYVVRGLH